MTDELNGLLKGIKRRQAITLRRLESLERAFEGYPAECPQEERGRSSWVVAWFLSLVGFRPRGADHDAA